MTYLVLLLAFRLLDMAGTLDRVSNAMSISAHAMRQAVDVWVHFDFVVINARLLHVATQDIGSRLTFVIVR